MPDDIDPNKPPFNGRWIDPNMLPVILTISLALFVFFTALALTYGVFISVAWWTIHLIAPAAWPP